MISSSTYIIYNVYNKYCIVSFLNVAAADPPQPEDDKDQAGQHEEDHGRQHGAVGQVVDGAAVRLHVAIVGRAPDQHAAEQPPAEQKRANHLAQAQPPDLAKRVLVAAEEGEVVRDLEKGEMKHGKLVNGKWEGNQKKWK